MQSLAGSLRSMLGAQNTEHSGNIGESSELNLVCEVSFAEVSKVILAVAAEFAGIGGSLMNADPSKALPRLAACPGLFPGNEAASWTRQRR